MSTFANNIGFKLDLYQGSDLNVDYASGFRTYATRRVWVRGLKEKTRYEDIVAAFEAQEGLSHPTINGLPLRRIRVIKVSCDKALLVARYQRTPSAFPPLPNGREAQYRTSYEAIEVFKSAFDENGDEVYDSFGLPDGKILTPQEVLANGAVRPVSVERRVPVVRLFTATQYTQLPTGIGSSFGYINSATVEIAGELWAPGVVRFDGFEMDTNVVYNYNGIPLLTYYNVSFAWTLRNGTHVTQVPVWEASDDPQSPGEGQWEISVEPTAETVDFNNLDWFTNI